MFFLSLVMPRTKSNLVEYRVFTEMFLVVFWILDFVHQNETSETQGQLEKYGFGSQHKWSAEHSDAIMLLVHTTSWHNVYNILDHCVPFCCPALDLESIKR